MKNILLGLAGILFAGTLLAGEVSRDGFRDFSSTDGRNIRGRIVKYDAQRKKLFFERDNKKQMWIAPAVFCQEDRDYIREWIVADRFRSESFLKISIKKKTYPPENKGEGVYVRKRIKPISYEITLKNKIGSAIKDVRIYYSCCVEQDRYGGLPSKKYWASGQIPGRTIEPGEKLWRTGKINLETAYREVLLFSHDADGRSVQNGTNIKKSSTDKVRGVWFKIYGPELDGVQVVRDVCLPADFAQHHSWPTNTFDSVLNPSSPKPVPTGLVRKMETKPANQKEYDRWFSARRSKIKFYMRSWPATKDKVRLALTELESGYDSQYETDAGDFAGKLGGFFSEIGDHKTAIYWYEKNLQAGGGVACRSWLSKQYSSGPPEIRNPSKAIEYAKILLEEDGKSAVYLDLLARGYARDSQFELAVKTQKKALERLSKTSKDTQKMREYKKRMALYKIGKPFTM